MSHSPSHYPNAYCVKCGTHTDTKNKHTIVLTNSSRALKGVCASCESEVYRVLPKIRAAAATAKPLTADEQKKYPDAFCVKCQSHTPTGKAHTVFLDNNSRAMTGECKSCGSEVYRILGGKGAEAPKAAAAPAAKVSLLAAAKPKLAVVARKPMDARQASSSWTYVAAAGVIAGIIGAFFVYAIL
jgi:hypothetical protein